MEECNVIEKMIKVESELCVNKNDQCIGMNVSLKSRNDVGLEKREQMLISTTDVCHSQFEVPSGSASNDHPNIKSICKDRSEGSVYSVPVTFSGIKDYLLLSELNTMTGNSENQIENEVCTDSDLHCDFLTSVSENAENVLLGLTESCDLHSSRDYACVDERERTLSENGRPCNESNSISTLEPNNLNGVLKVLSVKDTRITISNEKTCSTNEIGESRTCDSEKRKFFVETVEKQDSKSNLIDYFGESRIENKNNDFDYIFADEKEEKDDKLKAKIDSDSTFEEICFSENEILPDQQMYNHGALPLNKENHTALTVTEAVLYKCTYCSFSDWDLENLSSHVLTCFKKRKPDENQKTLSNCEPPKKIHVSSQNQPSIPPKNKLSFLSKFRPIVLPQMQVTQNKHSVPLKPKFSAHSKIAREVPQIQQTFTPKLKPSVMSRAKCHRKPHVSPKPRLSVIPYEKRAVLPQTQVPKNHQSVSSKPTPSIASKVESFILPQTPVTSMAQVIVSPQAQLVTSKTHHTATQETQVFHTTKSQLVVSSQSQLTVNSPSQLSVTSNSKIILPATQSLSLKPQVSVSPETKVMQQMQPIITYQAQLPIMSTTEHSSASERQIVRTPNVQFPLASGTKLTLGPHSPVPIVPETPLTISPQGLTIAQAGSQLLITRKVQQNAGDPNQPTLLGLGIGTNPTVAPKNIVLLPNLLFNSISPSTENVNGKQSAAMFQGQFILQTPTSALSTVAPVQLQQSFVYTPQSLTSQSQVVLSPLYTVSKNSVSSNVAQESKSSVTLFPFQSESKVTTLSTSAKNPAPSKQSGRTSSVLGKLICEICDDYVKDLGKLRNHMKCLHAINMHPKMIPSFNCQKCQFCFFTEQGLERHLLGSHGLVTSGLQEAADKGKDSGRCPICGWGYQSKLLNHVSADHKICLKPADLSYKCVLCGASFGVYKQFEKHVYSAHPQAMSKRAPRTPQSSSSAVK